MLSKEKRFGVTVLGIKGQGATFEDSISLLPPLPLSPFLSPSIPFLLPPCLPSVLSVRFERGTHIG